MRLRWYGHMQRMEENNEVKAIVDMMVTEKTKREIDGLRPKGHVGTENQEFGPLTPPSGKRRRRRRMYVHSKLEYINICSC